MAEDDDEEEDDDEDAKAAVAPCAEAAVRIACMRCVVAPSCGLRAESTERMRSSGALACRRAMVGARAAMSP